MSWLLVNRNKSSCIKDWSAFSFAQISPSLFDTLLTLLNHAYKGRKYGTDWILDNSTNFNVRWTPNFQVRNIILVSNPFHFLYFVPTLNPNNKAIQSCLAVDKKQLLLQWTFILTLLVCLDFKKELNALKRQQTRVFYNWFLKSCLFKIMLIF